MARKIQPRSKTPLPKPGQSSEDYWRERETRQRAVNIREEASLTERINRIFQGTQDSLEQEIESFYQKYAAEEGIDVAEARRRVSQIDMKKYERLAEQYVKAAHEGGREAAFSDEANEQMRLYNATMRINRLEMLKARCGIRAMEGYRLADQLINEALEERTYSEYERLAGILGNSVQFNENQVRAIVNASYQNATWSQRLWNNQALLSERIGAQLVQGILTGKGSDVLARNIQKLTGGSAYACQRLMRTELRRVQTAAAEQSMRDNGVTAYKFLVANGVNPCDECVALDGKVFKLDEMSIAVNAPPMHPNCHCCTAPAFDEDKWQRWLDGPAQAGVPWEEFERRNGTKDDLSAPDINGLSSSEKDKNIKKALSSSISRVTDKLNNSSDQTYHKSLLSGIIDSAEYRYTLDAGAPLSYNREEDVFYFRDTIVNHLETAEDYVITHDASHKLDYLYFKSWENQAFIDALESCAEEAYPRKAEIEGWFREGGKYCDNYAMADAFDALFYGNIQTIVRHKDRNYYYVDSTRLSAEIFADISSMLVCDGCNEPLLEKAIAIIKREFE